MIRADLVGAFIGKTEEKTKEIIDAAVGGVLFIDEAYSLSEPRALGAAGQDYGAQVIETLISAMENRRDRLCIIFAGYSREMERFLDLNPGMKSRVGRIIEFPDYHEDELWKIFTRMLSNMNLKWEPDVECVFRAYMRRLRHADRPGQFGNARTVRNTLERAQQCLASRTRELSNRTLEDLMTVKRRDFQFAFDEKQPADSHVSGHQRCGTLSNVGSP